MFEEIFFSFFITIAHAIIAFLVFAIEVLLYLEMTTLDKVGFGDRAF